jgi:hypothetical protein
MGSATVRRFALVAALVLLAPLWCRPATVARAGEGPTPVLVRVDPTGTIPASAIRRHASVGWSTAGLRPLTGRSLLAVVVIALLSLFRLVRWATLDPLRSAPSALAPRRHVIALRAPPLRRCV